MEGPTAQKVEDVCKATEMAEEEERQRQPVGTVAPIATGEAATGWAAPAGRDARETRKDGVDEIVLT